MVQLGFDLTRVELPLESTRHSLKIWNHVDRSCLAPREVARLERNGLRVGLSTRESWPAIQTILAAAKAEMRKEDWEGHTGLPVVIALGAIGEAETVFAYDDAGQLNGKTFSAGQKLMQVDYAVLAEKGGAVEARLTFEIRHDKGEMTWESSGGVVRQVPEYDRHVFEEIAARVVVPPGSTLVIGPNERAQQEYLVGGRFLEMLRDGVRREIVYLVTPQALRTKSKGSPSAR